ncbi:hypothetical protein LGM90_21160 [Burkholderia sp. AU28942]|nr:MULTISPECIES: hypothetical protein [Burkholderia]MCA8311021.1 hypothetical protein [Burkholderia sp. AU28942]QTO49938.1 hypothetical protein J8I86_01725 [Burkholderia latens]
MNSSLYIAILVGLTFVLVAMFAFGCYWLATKINPLPSDPCPTLAVVH